MSNRKRRIALFCSIFILLVLTAAAGCQSVLSDGAESKRFYQTEVPAETGSKQKSKSGSDRTGRDSGQPENPSAAERASTGADRSAASRPAEHAAVRRGADRKDGKTDPEPRAEDGKLLANVREARFGGEALRATVVHMIRRSVKAAAVPILTYHHISDGASAMVISRGRLEEHFAALRDAGYEPVFLSELRDFVLSGAELPEKPVAITFDDGYLSNATEAFPLLEQYNLKATIFIIGVSFGKDSYKETGVPMTPHFGRADALSMLDSGLVEFGAHTYDLHQWPQMETDGDARENMGRRPGDTLEGYLKIIRNDARAFNRFYRDTFGESTCLFSYPQGEITKEAAAVLLQEGYTVTVSTKPGINIVVRGKPETLRELCRYTISGEMTGEEVLALIQP